MRTWGRVFPRNPDGSRVKGEPGVWTLVETAQDGSNDAVYLTTLCQVLQLFLNESPFYATFGIPARTSVMMQVFPDYYVYLTQRQFSPYFASLIVAKVDAPYPSYRINVITNQGTQLDFPIATGS